MTAHPRCVLLFCLCFYGRGSERVGAAVAMTTAAAASLTRGHDSLKEQFLSHPLQSVDPPLAAFPAAGSLLSLLLS